MTVPAYALFVFLITGDTARIVGIQEMRSLQECIEQATIINTDKQNPFNAACYPTRVRAT